MIATLLGAVVATMIEWLPGVRRADVTGDGDRELVVGPHPDSRAGRFFRHFGSVGVPIAGLVIIVGVR